MTLSKLEIQQMLREMNVKFDADESYAALKHRLQEENHSLWLKSVSGARSATDGARKTLVRKRRKVTASEPTAAAARPSQPQSSTATRENPTPSSTQRPYRSPAAFQPHPIEKPEPGRPWKPVADGVEPFNRKKNVFESVLRRAGGVCERCGQPAGTETSAGELVPYHIASLDQGSEESVKNVVAVCPACCELLEQDLSARDLKDLKRKTRAKLYGSLQIIRKTHARTRRPFPGRRK